MSVDLVLNILAVITLVLALVLAGAWLLGVDREEHVKKLGKRRWLLSAGLSFSIAATFAITDDWIMAIAIGIMAVTELGLALFPDLPLDRLRTRPG